MRLLEISYGVSVNLDEVQVVQQATDKETIVIVGGESYMTSIPYKTLVALMGRKAEKSVKIPAQIARSVEQLARFQATATP